MVKQTKNSCIMRKLGEELSKTDLKLQELISLSHWLFKLGANHLDSMFHIVSGKCSHHSSALIHYSDDQ